MPMMMPSSHAMMADATGYCLIILNLKSHRRRSIRFIYRSYLVMVKAGNDPRLKDGASAKFSRGIKAVMVSQRYAN